MIKVFICTTNIHKIRVAQLQGYVESTGTMLNDITEISKSAVIADDVRQKLKRLVQDEYKRNQRLIEHVHSCQQELWNKQSMKEHVPACDMDWVC